MFSKELPLIVLLIEDDKVLASAISDYLSLEQVELDFAHSGELGLKLAMENRYDAILLDVMLPQINGYEVCQSIRQAGLSVPILMLTACETLDQKLLGFNAGVDDYVTKPVAMQELHARLKALIKRSTGQVAQKLQIEDLTLDLDTHQVYRGNAAIELSPQSWRILLVLAQNSPNVVAKSQIEQAVWQGETSDNNFKVQMHKLRQSIDKPFAKPLIHAIPKVGYTLRRAES